MIETYRTDNTDYKKNGDMPLLPINAKVNVELNGTWTLELEHPIDNEGRWRYLEEEAVVKCPSFNGDQLFRIKSIEKNDDSVLVRAYPIFFDSKNDCFLTDIRPTGKNGQEALNIMLAPNKKYSAQSDISRRATAYYEYMNLMEAINGDNANSFLNRWGGEILYDNFKIIVNERVGGDYGVELRYGKNIPANGITETVDMSEVVTRIYPKAYNGYKLSGNGYVDSPILSNYPTVKAATMKFDNIKIREDAQEDDEEKGIIICDTQADLDKALTEACKKQFEAGLDKPKVTIEADMVLLQNTDQYKDYEILETVSLGDTIHCRHDKLGIISDARVVGLEYDCILNRVTSVVLGQFQSNYIDNIASSVDKIDSVINSEGDIMAERVKGILDGITTQLRLQSTVAKKVKGRAFIAEDLDPNSPLYGCIAWGTQGIEIANRRTADGRDWDWSTAVTANGIVANAIVTGLLSDKTGTNFWNLDTGDFQMSSKAFTVDGQTIGQIAQGAEQNAINAANQALSDYADTVTKDIENLQSQVDGQVEDYYYDYEPSMQNIPASQWTTAEERKKHIGDRFFWKSKGYAYRFMENNGVWGWTLLQDTDITKAMQTAQNAKDTADGKRRTFITQPVPPYDIGDMWANGTDILTCSVSRASGSSYVSTDWEKFNKYTDDTVANQALEEAKNAIKNLTQEQVFNKLTNNGAVKGIWLENGQLYISFTNAKGGILTLGGLNNGDGLLEVYDEKRNIIGRWGKNGLETEGKYFAVNEKGNVYANEPRFSGRLYMSSIVNGSLRPERIEMEKTEVMCLAYKTSSSQPQGKYSLYIADDDYDSNWKIEEIVIGYGSVETLTVYADLALRGSGNAYIFGDLSVEGTKNRRVETKKYSDRLLYCYEMPSPMFGDIGEGKIDDLGICYIYLDDIFTETINTGIEYQVFLQKEGAGDLWVDSKEPAFFIVKGTPGLKFSWEIKAKQRDFEYERLEDAETTKNDVKTINYETQGQKIFEKYLLEKETAYEESN